MRAPIISLGFAAVVLGAAGCVSNPATQEPQTASMDRACENAAYDPLHLTSSSGGSTRDFEIESILMQQPTDPRLASINHRMYQTLHALDVELRRERRVAACEQPSETLQANSSPQSTEGSTDGASGADGAGANSGASGSSGPGLAGAPGNGGAAALGASGAATSAPSAAISLDAAAAGFGSRAATMRKTSLAVSPPPGGGNGLTAPKIVPGSDNNVVVSRLRKAAEQEKDPALRAKLWKEYNDYKQGASAK
jgi:hypothetical protein